MSLLKDIKTAVKNSGSNKAKIVYFKADSKVRIRFLQDVEEGLKIPFHDSFALGINVPCQEIYDRTCEYCDDEDLRTRDMFAWSVYDYDANEVKIILAAVNSFSPIPALIGMYEEYGTLTDRDYVITRTGAGTNTSYSVVPMDKAKFKNKKAKALTHKQILELIDKAFPSDQSDTKGNKPKKKIDDDDDWDEDDEDEELDYDEMSAQELYKLCKERDIEAKPKKKASYYIDLLEAADNAEYDDEDEEEEDDDDEW